VATRQVRGAGRHALYWCVDGESSDCAPQGREANAWDVSNALQLSPATNYRRLYDEANIARLSPVSSAGNGATSGSECAELRLCPPRALHRHIAIRILLHISEAREGKGEPGRNIIWISGGP
jgi:hypothetical protein